MIKIIAVGKVREKFFEDAIAEYIKRLSAHTNLSIIQVEDEKCPESISEKQAGLIREKEGGRILKNIRDGEYVITLEIEGKSRSSAEFAALIEQLALNGLSDITFVIGGSIGLSPHVSERADLKLSFSKMTFPHQLMRVILLEQIYRAFRIIKKEPYHK
ncbi:MAG: 23S rRNA (pseudouridine(1915)-N(3))-methyltransferase RlmH [Lachnospiraceae bacterium]|jgi:23S rRNA (pseudouridine1915-N3)-methyltransferase